MAPPEIRATLWADYLKLCRFWADHPPLRDMVQAVLKIKPRSKRDAPRLDLEEAAPGASIAALKGSFPGGRL